MSKTTHKNFNSPSSVLKEEHRMTKRIVWPENVHRPNLSDYEPIVGSRKIEELKVLAEKVGSFSMIHVNSTFFGGGVAEILLSLLPLFNEFGIKTKWQVIEGTERFFQTTKSFHNALQGLKVNITKDMLEEYGRVNRENAINLDFGADAIVIHDPQPAALVGARGKNKWIWRCHIDLSRPDQQIWNFLFPYLEKYDAAIFSARDFLQDLPIPQYIIPPSIDPLSDKNKELPREKIDEIYEEYKIPKDKPTLLQVSRFDRFKDPLGVIEAYRLVRKDLDCQLVLAGGGAPDDPEGAEVLKKVKEKADDPDIHVLNLPPESNIEINALQRGADVIIQKSTKEGFGLTVTEALWKGVPVVGGAVGGIKLQIVDNKTGYLVGSVEEAARRVKYLLENPDIAKRMGKTGKEWVRENFLMTRHLRDYLKLILVVKESKVHL